MKLCLEVLVCHKKRLVFSIPGYITQPQDGGILSTYLPTRRQLSVAAGRSYAAKATRDSPISTCTDSQWVVRGSALQLECPARTKARDPPQPPLLVCHYVLRLLNIGAATVRVRNHLRLRVHQPCFQFDERVPGQISLPLQTGASLLLRLYHFEASVSCFSVCQRPISLPKIIEMGAWNV